MSTYKWMICFGLLAISSAVFAQEAVITEEQHMIKTYPFSDPDPVPIMIRSDTAGKGPKLYPYFFFDQLSATGTEIPWNVVHMENPYIDVYIIPDEGGKLLGASEKSTGNEFIYHNHVRKYRQLAFRGPWTSGGIELNFGFVGHTATTATPVDYLVRRNADGSVSCFVGTMDLPSRTHWTVEYRLSPDKAFVESRPVHYNTTPLYQSYYVWMNTAAKGGDDLQFILPGNFHMGHNYDVPEKPWPISEDGRDLSWYKNNNFGESKSYFAVGELEDFAGGYWHKDKFGFGHWARYEEMPGHKYWIWALSRSGGIWEDLLTDTDGQYVEPQVGRLFDQSDHAFLAPHMTDMWRDVWFPFKDIGPMTAANPFGVFNLNRENASVTVGYCALQQIDDDLILSLDGKEVFRDHITLQPMETYEKTITLDTAAGNLRAEMPGKLSYADDPKANDINRPINFRDYADTSAEETYLAGERHEKGRNYDLALQKYEECIRKDPFHNRALTRAGEIYYRRAEYEKALSYAHQALDNEMYDPGANYLYGITSMKLGNYVDAKETLGWAARSMEYRSGAYCEMAMLYFLEGNTDLSLEYATKSLAYNIYNVRAYQVQATAYRILGDTGSAERSIGKILEIDPLNHLARFEQYLLHPDQSAQKAFTALIRSEIPHETYLEIAVYYANLGLVDDAVKILEIAPDQPTVHFWLAYLLKDIAPRKSNSYLEQAFEGSPHMVFPFREESIPVFEWADGQRPDNWKAKYYLGLIHWGKRRREEALALFEACKGADYSPFYIARGYLRWKDDPEKTIADFQVSRTLDSQNWRAWHHSVTFLNEIGQYDNALELARDASKRFPGHDIIKVDILRCLMNTERFNECASLLENLEILPYEGQRDIHDLYVRCHLHLGLNAVGSGDFNKGLSHFQTAKEYPERLGTGMPYEPDQRMQDYFMALCHKKTGDSGKAATAMKRVTNYTLQHFDKRSSGAYFGALALRDSGETEKANELLKNWDLSNQDELIRKAIEQLDKMAK